MRKRADRSGRRRPRRRKVEHIRQWIRVRRAGAVSNCHVTFGAGPDLGAGAGPCGPALPMRLSEHVGGDAYVPAFGFLIGGLAQISVLAGLGNKAVGFGDFLRGRFVGRPDLDAVVRIDE